MQDIQPYLRRIVDRFADPRVQAALKGFTKTLLFTFTDTRETWTIRAADGREAALAREAVEGPDIMVTTATDTLAGVMDGKINPAAAYLQRKIRVKGAMETLLKLQKLMG